MYKGGGGSIIMYIHHTIDFLPRKVSYNTIIYIQEFIGTGVYTL